MTIKKILFSFLSCFTLAIGIFFAINDFELYSTFMVLFSNVLTLLAIKESEKSYSNAFTLFFIFHIIYGLSGPVNVLLGVKMPSIFNSNYEISAYIFSYSMASLGLLISNFVVSLNFSGMTRSMNVKHERLEKIKIWEKDFLIASLFLVLVGSIFELINLNGIGGIEVLLMGKALVQSQIAELGVAMPSSEFIVVGFSFFGLYLGIITKSKYFTKIKLNVIAFILLSSPFLVVKIVLGQRGILLTLIASLALGITLFNPIRKIKFKFFISVAVVYLIMGLLYANRSIVPLLFDNPSLFVERVFENERMLKALNPGTSEFGTTFGNFNEHFNKYRGNFNYQLGESYIKGLVVPVPSFIYIGNKPIQIAYQFRNEFFLSEASRGSIAGTGFSSILEAYMNFGNYGVFVVYFICGVVLKFIDSKYFVKNVYLILVYVTCVPLVIGFHRSDFGTTYSTFVLRTIVSVSAIQLVLTLRNRNRKEVLK